MTDPTLQAYLEARQDYGVSEHFYGSSLPGSRGEANWSYHYGLYKVARYNAVKAGLIPETPQFDVEDGR